MQSPPPKIKTHPTHKSSISNSLWRVGAYDGFGLFVDPFLKTLVSPSISLMQLFQDRDGGLGNEG